MNNCCRIPLKVEDDISIKLKVKSESRVGLTVEEQIVVAGDYYEDYEGSYTVTPDFSGQTLETMNKHMTDDVIVEPIEVSRTSNPSGGTTVYIGGII